MGLSSGGSDRPLDLLLTALSNKVVIALIAVVTGSTVGTKLGRSDPWTGTDASNQMAEHLRLHGHEERVREFERNALDAIALSVGEHHKKPAHDVAAQRLGDLETDVREIYREHRPLQGAGNSH